MSRRHLFGSLLGMMFVMNLARVVFAPLIEPLAAAFGVAPAALGIVATAAWLGSALSRLPTGYLLTRVPRHHVVLGSGGLLSVAALLTVTVESVPMLTAMALILGLGTGAYITTANPLVSELFPARIGRAIGFHGTAAQLAAVAAPLFVTGVLLVGRWQTAFLLLGVAMALTTAATAVAARRATLPTAGHTDTQLLGALTTQWRLLLAGVVLVGVLSFVWNGVFNFYVTYLLTKDVGANGARLLLTIVFAAGVPAFAFTGRLVDRVPPIPVLLAIIAGFAASVYALTVADDWLAFIAISVTLGFVVHGAFPAVDTYLLGTLPDHHRASAYAGYSGSMMVIQSLGSGVVGGLVGAGYSFDVVFRAFALGLGGLLVVLVFAYGTGRFPAD